MSECLLLSLSPTRSEIRFQTALASEAATEQFGARLASALAAGDTVLLSGDLGAGKSCLARHMIREILENPDLEVPSPSYTLVNVYESLSPNLPEIWHADLYRLSSADEVLELGLEEAFHTAITMIEWPDRLGDILPERRLEIQLSKSGVSSRQAEMKVVGDRWESLIELLETL